MASKQMMFETDARHGDRQRACRNSPAPSRPPSGPAAATWFCRSRSASPRITKDGVTVSKEIELPQPFENMGAKLVNMVASKTGDVAGDGTTTATVLAEAIYLEGLKDVTTGVNPVQIQRGITKAAEIAAEAITAHGQEGERPRRLQARRHHLRQRR